MPWCPICRNEYREGIKLCAECQVELVDSLEEEAELPAEQQTVQEADMLPEEQEETAGQEDAGEEAPVYHAYQNSAVKAEDNRTSAYTLFLVGILGFALDVLVFTDVIGVFHNDGMNKYLICGVMGALFILFIVFGVVSMRASRILLVQAQSEDSLVSELTKWCDENLSAEQIDSGLFDEDLPEEQKYFKRTDKMQKVINDKFMNLDQGLLEHFVDEYYQGLFGKE